MTPRIDRRHFLALGFGAVAWACSRGSKDGTDVSSNPGDTAYSVVVTAPQGIAVGDTRQGFAVFRGQRPTAVSGLRVRLVPPDGRPFSVEAQHVKAERGPGGAGHQHVESTEVTDIYVVRHDFDKPGVWSLDVRFNGGRGTADFILLPESPSPMVGRKAIASESPTTDDHRGVDPICTRTPVCSMHELTIADALAAGKPAVIVFGTPQFCTSRTCGPVVDYVERAKKKFGNEASFIHVEVWKNAKDAVNTQGGEAPTFTEWKLDTEPWIFFVDEKGIVRDRWIGAVGPDEVKTGVDALLGSGPYPRLE
jgi:hypothetical protein